MTDFELRIWELENERIRKFVETVETVETVKIVDWSNRQTVNASLTPFITI